MPTELKEKYPFSVDSWTTVAKRKRHHFLTHAHSDHTAGIESFFDRPIYCTDLTRRLVLRRFPKLCTSSFIILEIGESKLVPDDEDAFTVTAMDANHCPGAVMLVFEGDFGNVLHTGDCRLTENCLRNVLGKYRKQQSLFDCVFLDCTFGKEDLKMPSKTEASLQVRECILDHPQAQTVYLASNMLGLEELWNDLAEYFNTKIYVDKQALPQYYADMKIVVPELMTDDPQATRFHICEGSPFLYQRAKKKFMQARKMGQPAPLFIRPSAQYYTFEERLEGAGCGIILDGDLRRSSRQRRHLRVPKAAERDEHGIWHVCYSIHSCRSELERAMEVLWPKEVISTSPHCHASEVVSERAGLHHVDISSRTVRVLEVQQLKERKDAAERKHNVELICEVSNSAPSSEARRKVSRENLSSPKNSTGRKKARSEEKPKKDYHSEDLAAVVPLFGKARHHIPPSPPLSFASMDSLENHEFKDSQSSVECLPDGCCETCPEENQEACQSGNCATLLKSCPLEGQEGCPSGNSEALLDCTNLGVFANPAAIPETDAAVSKEKTKTLKVTVQTERKDCKLDELAQKENIGWWVPTPEKNVPSRSVDHTREVNGFQESTRRLYRSFMVPIPSDLPSLLDLYRSL
ncbi:unnamed protein product [Calypogeia fissa]